MGARIAERHGICRREFIAGAWRRSTPHQETMSAGEVSCARIAVRARPDRLDSVRNALAELDFTVTADQSPDRLVVSVAATELAPVLSIIADLPSVVDAAVLDAATSRVAT